MLLWERWKKQPDKCASGTFAQNLTKLVQAGSWVLYQLTPAKSDWIFFLGFVRKEGVNASWRNADTLT